jgi:EAP30/Vps36 family
MLTVLLPHHAAAQQHAHTNRGVLKRFGGVMTLPDVYAVFNRARGTELISPLDLLTVSGMLGPLSLGMSLHTFPSGVAVIQVCEHLYIVLFICIDTVKYEQYWCSAVAATGALPQAKYHIAAAAVAVEKA